MPAAMIHLLAARYYQPEGDPRFLLGCIAPDYAFEREFKDSIHLRDRADRIEALNELRKTVDERDSFSLGWLLHLFTDLRWDDTHFSQYRAAHEQDPDWFRGYHKELHAAGYALYHRCDWAEPENAAILAVDLATLPDTLPVNAEGIELFRSILIEKTRESEPDIHSDVFTFELTERFASETAAAFRQWMESGR